MEEEIITRAIKSNKDYLNSKFTSQEDLEKESENW